MPKSKFAKGLRERDDIIYNAGFFTGEQFTADIMSIAAKQAGLSKAKIIEMNQIAMNLREHYKNALLPNIDPEADVSQHHIDELLKNIFGDLFVPFEKRYEDLLKKVRY